jgi:hypothetical protein
MIVAQKKTPVQQTQQMMKWRGVKRGVGVVRCQGGETKVEKAMVVVVGDVGGVKAAVVGDVGGPEAAVVGDVGGPKAAVVWDMGGMKTSVVRDVGGAKAAVVGAARGAGLNREVVVLLAGIYTIGYWDVFLSII